MIAKSISIHLDLRRPGRRRLRRRMRVPVPERFTLKPPIDPALVVNVRRRLVREQHSVAMLVLAVAATHPHGLSHPLLLDDELARLHDAPTEDALYRAVLEVTADYLLGIEGDNPGKHRVAICDLVGGMRHHAACSGDDGRPGAPPASQRGAEGYPGDTYGCPGAPPAGQRGAEEQASTADRPGAPPASQRGAADEGEQRAKTALDWLEAQLLEGVRLWRQTARERFGR